ncbi:PPE family protein [Mycobacterium kyorinense]|uniref:PPE family protein n=1 Tax=Mycobacterium kyorinense TaxID=487514 RepID=A0A1X1XDT6_9MYCO|nr:PPE family protein [Mycobacterium kyorinense]ORV96979.1 hypothetical protein AWC14_01125 [Mycobacterium kyorinense]
MYFAALPPEINSGRMYAGAGSGSLLAAAAAWDGLAAELRSTAASYSSVIVGLTASWQGPSSVSMATAAAPYVAWMSTTAAQAEHTAAQARAAAAAYQTAFAATVPPSAIAANRSQLASLVATNVFGQNTAAIASTEAQYGEMWAQDAAAMTTYAGQSAAATQVTPFSPPPQTTNPAGTAGQAAAVAQATGTSAGTNAQSALSQLMSATPQALQSLATPAAADPPASPLSSLASFLSSLDSSPLATIAGNVELIPKAILPANDILISIIMGLVIGGRTLSDQAVSLEAPLFAQLGTSAPALGAGLAGGGSAVSAGMGGAGLVGALSVPPSWAAATPTVTLAASVLQGAGAAAAPAVTAEGAGTVLSQITLASLAGGALGGAVPRGINVAAVRRGRPNPGKDNAKGEDSQTPNKLKQVLAEASQKPESVQHWHTDKEHLESLLDQLSKKPGIHAVHVSKRGKNKTTPPKTTWG